MKLIEGQIIHGRYRLDERIAKGGMGEVWRATDMVLNHEVGHRLGHMDNENVCASPNGPAPLMQEQSISLRGCSIRWWPQSLELWTAGL